MVLGPTAPVSRAAANEGSMIAARDERMVGFILGLMSEAGRSDKWTKNIGKKNVGTARE